MQALMQVVRQSQQVFVSLLTRALREGTLRAEQYQRYLSMQYHLTRGVQTYFMRAAAHRDLVHKRGLRKFLFDFANEEEQHYLVAANDLEKMGLSVLGEPLDVMLWHAYFRSIIDQRPFVRLGAACILENISGGPVRALTRKAMQAPFLTAANTRFLVLHQHEAVPHGDQIVAALEAASLDSAQMADLVVGAKTGMVLYLRMAEWALFPDALSAAMDDVAMSLDLHLVEGAPAKASNNRDGVSSVLPAQPT